MARNKKYLPSVVVLVGLGFVPVSSFAECGLLSDPNSPACANVTSSGADPFPRIPSSGADPFSQILPPLHRGQNPPTGLTRSQYEHAVQTGMDAASSGLAIIADVQRRAMGAGAMPPGQLQPSNTGDGCVSQASTDLYRRTGRAPTADESFSFLSHCSGSK